MMQSLVNSEINIKNQWICKYDLIDSIQLPQILELVNYITVMPDENETAKRQFRYPFYACELLCCQIPKVDELILGEDKSAINQLLQFVQQNQPVNPVLAGYVSKVLANLSRQKPLIFYQECYQNQNFIESLARQLQSRSIAEIIIKLICIDQAEQQDFIQERSALLKITLDQIGQSEDFEIPQNVCQIVYEILSQAYIIANGQPLLDLLTNEYLPKLCGHAVSENVYISLSAGEIIYQILTLVLKNKQRQESEETVFHLDIQNILKHIEEALPNWIQYLSTQSKLGQHKVKLVEIICFTINLQSESFPNVLAQANVFGVFNELLALHDKNNIFQLIYQRFIQVVFDHKYEALIQNLFIQSSFTSFLLSLSSETNLEQKKGYFGFITKFAKYLEDSAHKDPSIFGQYIQTEEWKQFRAQYFEKAQQISEQELGGLNKKVEKPFGEEENIRTTEVQQITNLFGQFNLTENEQQNNNNGADSQSNTITWDSNAWNTTSTTDNDQNQSSWDNQQPSTSETQLFGVIEQQPEVQQQQIEVENQLQQQENPVQLENQTNLHQEEVQQPEVPSNEQAPQDQQTDQQFEIQQVVEEKVENVEEKHVVVQQDEENQESKPLTEQQEQPATQETEEQQQVDNHFWQLQQDSKQEDAAIQEFNHNS